VKPKAHEGCSEVLEEDLENAFVEERKLNGQYQYRYCRMLFDTIK